MGKRKRGLGFKQAAHVDPRESADRLRELENVLNAMRGEGPVTPLRELSELLGVEVESISVHVPGIRAGNGKPIRMAPGTWIVSFAVPESKHAVRVRVKSAWLRSPGYLTQLAGNAGRDPSLPAFTMKECRTALRLMHQHVEMQENEENQR
jgi:hypothetical protein